MNMICGIPITDEHAQNIRNTIDRINEAIAQADFNMFLDQLRYTLGTNPHNTFKGSAEEYIRIYYPEKIKYLK
jgi:hypothetical protein